MMHASPSQTTSVRDAYAKYPITLASSAVAMGLLPGGGTSATTLSFTSVLIRARGPVASKYEPGLHPIRSTSVTNHELPNFASLPFLATVRRRTRR